MLYINQDVFQPTGLEKLNDASTKMYFNQQGLENLNDTPT